MIFDKDTPPKPAVETIDENDFDNDFLSEIRKYELPEDTQRKPIDEQSQVIETPIVVDAYKETNSTAVSQVVRVFDSVVSTGLAMWSNEKADKYASTDKELKSIEEPLRAIIPNHRPVFNPWLMLFLAVIAVYWHKFIVAAKDRKIYDQEREIERKQAEIEQLKEIVKNANNERTDTGD